ncbi:MAG TPA: M81 family metallopeptidase [Chthoniobacteraceae bacterium]|nr:M81 family metallopeptidase [Chthoniobacteraceae bacterium]
MSYRVAIINISHESNTFANGLTTAENFRSHLFQRGADVLDYHRVGKGTIAGALSVLEPAGVELIPTISANTTPGPMVADAALKEFWAMVEADLKAAGRIDGVFAPQHGAAVSEIEKDMDGWWLTQIRRVVGPEVPIIGTLDPHCFITEAMAKAANALLPYKTNPHVDSFERGVKAATLLLRTLKGEINPKQTFCLPPMIMNIERQHSGSEPLASLCRACDELENTPGVLDASVILGYPYSDLPEMGSGMQVIADGNAELSREKALELGQKLWDEREALLPSLLTPEAALAEADATSKPVCLLDMGDNVGGGGSGQGTWLLPLLAKRTDLKTFFTIYDPAAAQKAIEAGPGATVSLCLGGKSDAPSEGEAFSFTGKVKNIPPHQYRDLKVRHGGRKDFIIGPSALVVDENESLHILITSVRTSPNSYLLMTNCGVHPHDVDLIVAKGVNAPLAAFDGLCTNFIKINTPGLTSADPNHFPFVNRRKPFHPFEADAPFRPEECLLAGR